MKTDILIIGGGLSGLALAWQLEQASLDYQLIEARARFGGRIHSHITSYQTTQAHFDMGPAWFWPGQPRIAALIKELGLNYFEQYANGGLLHETAQGEVQQGSSFASMQESYRLAGSLNQLIATLVERIPPEKRHLNCAAHSICQAPTAITTQQTSPTQRTLFTKTHHPDKLSNMMSQQVVLALPPRIAAQNIEYHPKLSDAAYQAMHSIPTWMAGHAKIIAIYQQAFWREAGLSGDASSQRGPMVEIHDASPHESGDFTGPYALFGFVGTPVATRAQQTSALLQAAVAQLVNLFGEQASQPIDIVLQDWAFETETATALDHEPLYHHPDYGLPNALTNLYHNRLMLGSTEASPQFGGYLEGALEAAEISLQQILANQ